MTLRRLGLTIRLHRFEVFASLVAFGVLSFGAFIGAARIAELMPPATCLTDNAPPGCDRALSLFYGAQGTYSTFIAGPLLAASYIVGLFVGVPVVARELERGTTRLAWSLGPSRWRWYVAKVVPLLVMIAALTFLAGVALDRFYAVTNPLADPSRSFDSFGTRGGLVASRAVFIFAVAVAVGAISGRAWPSLIVATLVVALGLAGGERVHQDVLLRSEAIYVEGLSPTPGDLFVAQAFLLPDGRYVGWE